MDPFRLKQERREGVRSWGDEVLDSMQAAIDGAAIPQEDGPQEDGSREAEMVELAGRREENGLDV